MITIIEQKILSTDPMTAVAFVYDLKEEDWKVIGAKEGELNTIIYEGCSEQETFVKYNALTELVMDDE